MAYMIRDGMHVIGAPNVIDGAEGTIFATIDGETHGIALCRNMKATATKNKTAHKRLGTTTEFHKARGLTLSASMEVYAGGAIFQDMIEKYARTGEDTYFEILATNEDPSSSAGIRTVKLKYCNIDSVDVMSLDIETDALTETVNFTFEDFEYIDQFSNDAEAYN